MGYESDNSRGALARAIHKRRKAKGLKSADLYKSAKGLKRQELERITKVSQPNWFMALPDIAKTLECTIEDLINDAKKEQQI